MYSPNSKSFQPAILKAVLICLCVYLASNKSNAQHGIMHTPEGPLIELSESTIEAIDSGVSLTFVCDFAEISEWFFLKWPSQHKLHRFVISKHALSDRYLVHRDDKPTPSIFRSSSQGVLYMTKSIQALFRDYVQENPDIQLKVSLSKYDLPAPMRLSAFTSKQWSFNSGWGAWQSAN